MLPDGPNTSETQMSLPALPLTQNRLLSAPPLTVSALANNLTNSNEILIEKIIPGIHFSKSNNFWTPDRLQSHGFTHIINIDRHITQRLEAARKDYAAPSDISSSTVNDRLTDSPIISTNKQSFLYETQKTSKNAPVNTLELNFGEESFLTTVLPNCYKAVKFIDKALQNGGAILVIDQFNDQKCLTIVIGYLMYKNNINFNDAFQRVKSIFKKAELEPFFISQLYEYEPILQVERAQSRGHSCSRELRSAQLKRKKIHDDTFSPQNDFNYNLQPFLIATSNTQHSHYQSYSDNSSDVAME